MANTVVIFGMAHSGKSTCAGYIYDQSMKGREDYDFEKYIGQVKEELGSAYDASRDFGYLLEKSKDERIRKNKKGVGDSKELHIRFVQFPESEFVIVDTPGAQHKAVQRQKGMYYGDIGIFCIEIEDIINDRLWDNQKYFLTFMSTLVLWTKFKRKTIIALTKMDVADYSEEKYEYACGILKQLCENVEISEIIPISVDVKNRMGHNIFMGSQHMLWYKGKNLIQVIGSVIHQLDLETSEKELLFYIDRQYMRSRDYIGKCWRIKVMKGILKTGQKICLSPVRVNNEFYTITAEVKSIRADLDRSEGIRYIDYAKEGDFVGIDLNNIVCEKKKIEKREFDTVCTTCGFPSNAEFDFSDKFIFRTGIKYSSFLGVKRQMDLLWFGRAVTFEIISKEITANGVNVYARMMNKYLTMPRNKKQQYMVENFIVRYDHNLNLDPFMEIELLKIGGEISEYNQLHREYTTVKTEKQ